MDAHSADARNADVRNADVRNVDVHADAHVDAHNVDVHSADVPQDDETHAAQEKDSLPEVPLAPRVSQEPPVRKGLRASLVPLGWLAQPGGPAQGSQGPWACWAWSRSHPRHGDKLLAAAPWQGHLYIIHI